MLNSTKTQSRPKLLFLVPAISQTHKSLENSQDFFCQDKDQDFYLKTKTKTKTLGLKTKTKTLFFVLEAPRDQDFGLEDYITDYNRNIYMGSGALLAGFEHGAPPPGHHV